MMSRLLLLIFALFLATASLAQKGWKTDPHIIFLHRGARAIAAEGSIEAVHEAIRQGADGIEIDLRLTLDGHVVNYHNQDTLVKGFGLLPVEWLTLNEVRAMNMGSWFAPSAHGARVATLEEILQVALPNSLYLRIELKKPNVKAAVEELLNRYEAWHLVGSSVEGTFEDREVLKMPFLTKDLWMMGGEDDPDVLRGLMSEHGKGAFRVNVDDCRIFASVLGRHPSKRPFRDAIPERDPKETPPPPTLNDLTTRLRGNHRLDAWRAALELGHRGATEELRLAWGRKAIGVHAAEAAAWCLPEIKCDDATRSALIEDALRLDRPSVTRMVAYAIGRLKMRSRIPLLRALAGDGITTSIRAAAVWSLGELDDVTSARLFRGLVADTTKDTPLRIQSAIAIGKTRDILAHDALVAALAMGPPPVSLLAVETLGLLGLGRSAPLLGELLSRAKESDLKAWAIIALCNSLAMMGPKGEKELIRNAVNGGPIVRREALYALSRNGPAAVSAARREGASPAIIGRLGELTR